jgi:hypothetical protein
MNCGKKQKQQQIKFQLVEAGIKKKLPEFTTAFYATAKYKLMKNKKG